jgi:type II secretory pathway component PulK
MFPWGLGARGTLKQRGIALAIVVWFLAAMSLLVSGIVFQARVDTRMAQLHVARAKATAAGDGAMQLFLAELVAAVNKNSGEPVVPFGEYVIGDRNVSVKLVPAAGLIDLQSAPGNILAGLFHSRGQVDEGEAKTLADNVIKLRSGSSGRTRDESAVVRLSAIEDLLRADGVTRSIFDRLRDLVTVGGGGRQGVDWALAPASVLEVLAAVDSRKAAALSAGDRGEAESGKKGPRGRGRVAFAGRLRLDAYVRDGSQTWLRRRWVEMNASESGSLPWHFNRTEVVRVVVQN